jgi:hypothetical protein
MKTDDEIKKALAKAFEPLRCAVEVFDYDKRLRFRVFDQNDSAVFACPEILLSTLRDEARLTDVISQAREAIKAKGIALN